MGILESEILAPYECEKLKFRKSSVFALQNLNDNDDIINDIDNFSDCGISVGKNIHDGNHESGTSLSATIAEIINIIDFIIIII